MREFNTRTTEGNYSITFETDDRKAFEQVQSLCRLLIDGKDGDAIPIEWIKKWCLKHYPTYPRIVTEQLLKKTETWRMIEDWEEEQASLFEKQITEECTLAERFADWEKENESRKGEEEK